jgi:hypothetical protein
MALDSNQYRDPMLVLEAKQEAELRRKARTSCDGCAYKSRLWGVEFCELSRTSAGTKNMRRCDNYSKEKE